MASDEIKGDCCSNVFCFLFSKNYYYRNTEEIYKIKELYVVFFLFLLLSIKHCQFYCMYRRSG